MYFSTAIAIPMIHYTQCVPKYVDGVWWRQTWSSTPTPRHQWVMQYSDFFAKDLSVRMITDGIWFSANGKSPNCMIINVDGNVPNSTCSNKAKQKMFDKKRLRKHTAKNTFACPIEILSCEGTQDLFICQSVNCHGDNAIVSNQFTTIAPFYKLYGCKLTCVRNQSLDFYLCLHDKTEELQTSAA